MLALELMIVLVAVMAMTLLRSLMMMMMAVELIMALLRSLEHCPLKAKSYEGQAKKKKLM
jgi:hypothetical protein